MNAFLFKVAGFGLLFLALSVIAEEAGKIEELTLMEEVLEYLGPAGIAISLFAVTVINGDFTVAAWRYARRFRETTQEKNFNVFKIDLGGVLLLGLEILVLPDFVGTITVTPTFLSLGVLAAIVVLRRIVSRLSRCKPRVAGPGRRPRRIWEMTEPVVYSLGGLTQLLEICGAGFLFLGIVFHNTRWF